MEKMKLCCTSVCSGLGSHVLVQDRHGAHKSAVGLSPQSIQSSAVLSMAVNIKGVAKVGTLEERSFKLDSSERAKSQPLSWAAPITRPDPQAAFGYLLLGPALHCVRPLGPLALLRGMTCTTCPTTRIEGGV